MISIFSPPSRDFKYNTCYILITGTKMSISNLRVYERHPSIAWAQMSLKLVSVSNSNGGNESGQAILASSTDDVSPRVVNR